ncbi:MAG: hypothetical protein HY901_13230 [Deltaproteobacteria bacterium]|nr:hypothetical protein [Deltaproteobacteria bacterium]
MGERDDAKREIGQARQRMSDVVDELSRRATGSYVMGQTREVAMRKTSEWSGRARQSPVALGLLGGAIGSALGALLAQRGQPSREERWNPASTEDEEAIQGRRAAFEEEEVGEGTSLREKVQQGKQELQGKASEAKETVRGKIDEAARTARGQASHLREHLPDRRRVRSTASDYYRRALEEQPLTLGLGAILFGLIAGFMIPESSQEQRSMGPIKQKARQKIGEAEERLEQRLESTGAEGEEEPRRHEGLIIEPGSPSFH